MLQHEINKIFFVGLGGAGQRHLRIFKNLLPKKVEFSAYRAKNKTPLLNADFTVNNKSSIEEQYNLILFDSLNAGLENCPDLIVISTPSSLHYEVASMSAKRGINIFIEKPFSHNLKGFKDFENLVVKNNIHFFVSFQRRFHPYLLRIKDILTNNLLGKIINANFNVASYVPSWHPYEDYQKLYACRLDLGGGVLLTEIHEIDLCYWYFGLPTYVTCVGGNYSNNILDVEDTSHLILDYIDFSVQLNLCFMQKFNRRDFFIAGEDGYIDSDTMINSLKFVDYKNSDCNENLSNSNFINDDMFIAQAKYFLNEFKRSDSKKYLELSKSSLQIVKAAKNSINKGTRIKI